MVDEKEQWGPGEPVVRGVKGLLEKRNAER